MFGKNSGWICRILAWVGLAVVIMQDIGQLRLVHIEGHVFFSEMLLLTSKSLAFKLIIDVLSILLLLFFEWDDELSSHSKGLSDLYSISVAVIFGLHLMVMAANLLSIYLSVEMVSIGSYLMVSYKSEKGLSTEAGLKYVLFGAASSAVMLYGVSLLYGFGGTLNLFTGNLLPGLLQVNPVSVSLALVLFFAGVGFKLTFVPDVHFWVPDIYEGTPGPIAAFLSTLVKIAAFSLLINFLTPFIYYPKWTAFDFRAVFFCHRHRHHDSR